MSTLKGSQLGPAEQRKALARFIYRYTGEHKPRWAHGPMPDGQPYPVQFANDADWLAHTDFEVTKAGHLDERYGYCTSYPTWPNGRPVATSDRKIALDDARMVPA